MYPQNQFLWDDSRRRNWLEQIDPWIKERVSRQPAGKRRTWLARGDIKAKGKEIKQSRKAQILAPAIQQQQMMLNQMPLGDREKLALQQAHQEKMAERGYNVGRESADIAHQRRELLAERGYDVSAEQAERARKGRYEDELSLWRTKQTETPQTPPSMGDIRARIGQEMLGGGNVAGAERWLGVPEPPGTPSPTEQAGNWLQTGQPPAGATPGWEQRYQEYRTMGTQPETDYEALRTELAKWINILRSIHKPGMMGAIGGEVFDEQTKNQALSMIQQISQQLQQISGQTGDKEYKIGQIITNPQGQQGIIVGVDPNTGEPLIEPL